MRHFLIFAAFSATAQAASPDLQTLAEKTEWKQTGRYEEAVRICDGLAKAHPTRARCVRFGKTLEQRPMLALLLGGETNAQSLCIN
jgi:hypothetical protein